MNSEITLQLRAFYGFVVTQRFNAIGRVNSFIKSSVDDLEKFQFAMVLYYLLGRAMCVRDETLIRSINCQLRARQLEIFEAKKFDEQVLLWLEQNSSKSIADLVKVTIPENGLRLGVHINLSILLRNTPYWASLQTGGLLFGENVDDCYLPAKN